MSFINALAVNPVVMNVNASMGAHSSGIVSVEKLVTAKMNVTTTEMTIVVTYLWSKFLPSSRYFHRKPQRVLRIAPMVKQKNRIIIWISVNISLRSS